MIIAVNFPILTIGNKPETKKIRTIFSGFLFPIFGKHSTLSQTYCYRTFPMLGNLLLFRQRQGHVAIKSHFPYKDRLNPALSEVQSQL